MPLPYQPPALRKLQHWIRNFRDLAKYSGEYIKRGMIYRSSSLIAYQQEVLFTNLKLLDIKSIIDLRTEIEMMRESYRDWFLIDVHLYWVHLDISMPDEILEKYDKISLPFYHQFIWYILEFNKKELRKIFNLLTNEKNYSFIIHCHEGRDRTGIIVALILLLLNTPQENIVKDYTASDPSTRESDILFLIEEIKKRGGIEEYLEWIGIEKQKQEEIRRILSP